MTISKSKTSSFLLLMTLGCVMLLSTPAKAQDSACDFSCWVKKLKITVDYIPFEASSISGGISNLVIYDIELGVIDSRVPSPAVSDDPSIYVGVTLPSAKIDGNLWVKIPVLGNKTGSVHATATDVEIKLTIALKKGEDDLINKTYVPDNSGATETEMKGCYMAIGNLDLDLTGDFSSSTLLGSIIEIVKDSLLKRLDTLVCPTIRDLFEENVTAALGVANGFIREYWNAPQNLTLPLLKPMVDLRTSPLIDSLDFILNELLGVSGPLNITYIVSLFSHETNVFKLSTFISDGLEFVIPIEDLNANITLGINDVVIKGLDTFRNISMLVPVSQVTLHSFTDLAQLGINVSWYINVSVQGDMISNTESLYEDAIIATHLQNNLMNLALQLASPKGVAGTYSQKQFFDLGCLAGLIDPNGTGLTYFDLNMTFDYIVLTAEKGNLEEDVRALVNNIAALFIDNYKFAIPPFVNGIMGDQGMPAINKLLSNLLAGTSCADLEDEPFSEVDGGATAAAFVVAIVLAVLVAIVPCFMTFKGGIGFGDDDDDNDAEEGEGASYEHVTSSSGVEMSDLSKTPEYYNNNSSSYGVSPAPPYTDCEGDDEDNNNAPPPPCPTDEEVKRQTLEYYGDDEDMPPPPCPTDEEVKRQTMSMNMNMNVGIGMNTDAFAKPGADVALDASGSSTSSEAESKPTYLCGCTKGGKLRELIRTDAEGASLFLHPQLSLFVRMLVPLLLFATFALFISSNTGVGASVFVYLMVGKTQELALPSLFDFGLINSVTDMWTAGVYPLAILIAFMSGIWPYAKVVLMIICWFFPTAWMKASTRGKMLNWLDFLGKWSLLDTYVMIMMLVAFHFRIDFPVVNKEAVEAGLRADIYVYPAYGFVSLIAATLVSLFMSHVIIGLHRLTIPDPPGTDCDDAKNWKVMAFYAVKDKSKAVGMIIVIAIAVLLVVSLIITILGSVLNTFSFDFVGLAGWALPMLDIDPHREYSVITLTEEVPGSARRPNSFTVRFTQIVFIMTAFVFPIMHIVAMIVLWLAPLTRKIQHYLYYVCEILSAWSCIDVFIISIIAAVLEIEQFAGFMVGDKCDFLVPYMEEYLKDVLEPHVKCFAVLAKLQSGCWVLFITAIVYTTAYMVLLRLVHFGLEVRANNGEVPEKRFDVDDPKLAKKQKRVNTLKNVGSKIFTAGSASATTKSSSKSKSPQNTVKSQYSNASITIEAGGVGGPGSSESATIAIDGSTGTSPVASMTATPRQQPPPHPPPPQQPLPPPPPPPHDGYDGYPVQ